MNKADLHIHSTASDGRLSPREVLATAQAVGLEAIALTDHDTVDGLIQLIRSPEGKATSVAIIPGIEFSTDLPGSEVHILGYHINPLHDELTSQLNLLIDDRIIRAKKIVAKLVTLGYSIDYQRVLAIAGDATAIGRPHIARALLEKKYFSRISDVFDELLHTEGPAYVPHYKMTPKDVIELIHQSGGVAVLAHPAMVYDDKLVQAVIEQGLDGLEVFHPTHGEADVVKYQAMAQKYRLLITGGSDFHGIPGRFPDTLGIFTIDKALADQLPINLANHSLVL